MLVLGGLAVVRQELMPLDLSNDGEYLNGRRRLGPQLTDLVHKHHPE